MRNATRRLLFSLCASTSLIVGAACSASDPSAPASPPPTPAEPSDASMPPPDTDGGPLADAAPQTHPVTFSYKPSWKGVKSVEVVGAFGQAADWKSAFVTLADDGSGTFTGTSPALASGQYAYVFKVTGDEAAAAPAAYVRYAVDPSLSAFFACPAASPTFSDNAPNPCSQLTVPQPAASKIAHARGMVVSSGAPVAGYLVVIERDEPSSHHSFVDRTTTHADGKFDLAVAVGTYRVQVLHPTYYAKTDAQRTAPESFAAVRRSISTPILIDTDTTINAAEVAYDGYASMQPRGAAALPTTFTFPVATGAKARAAVYGTGSTIGDPWWIGAAGTATSEAFDGTFNTKAAKDGGVQHAAQYFWGAEQQYPKADGGVAWTAQSMVLPIQWP